MNLPMVDWISATFDIENYEEQCEGILNRLEELKQQAQELRSNHLSEKILHQIGGETFEVLPNGHKSYAYILHTHNIELRLAKHRSNQDETYPIFAHIKSEFLWSEGPEKALIWLKNWIEKNFGPIKGNKINRADLCCHTDELNFDISDIECFKGRYNKDKVHRDRKSLEGFEFGSRNTGKIFARIYNKVKEVFDGKTKTWFIPIWSGIGLNIPNVWNVEFELKRNLFKETEIESCEDFFSRIKDLWTYCTDEWLIWTMADNERSDRWSTKEEWLNIQKAFDNFKGREYITRQKQAEAELYALIPSAMGYLTSHAALSGYNDPHMALSSLIIKGERFLANKDTSFRERVQKKRKLKGL